MIGKLKAGRLLVGHRKHFKWANGEEVKIVAQEDHPIFGRRYKVEGYNEWFEANCFEYIK